jgi:hypothetical protein
MQSSLVVTGRPPPEPPPRQQKSVLHFCTVIDLAAYSPLRAACSYAYRETGKLLRGTVLVEWEHLVCTNME